METRMCSTCREIKPITEFYFKVCNNKYNSYCRECQRIYDKLYKRAYREMNQEYVKKNRDNMRERMREKYRRKTNDSGI